MFKTENKLKNLFEYARFTGDRKIEKLAEDTLARYPEELGDDVLESVSAAGDVLEKFRPDPEDRDTSV